MLQVTWQASADIKSEGSVYYGQDIPNESGSLCILQSVQTSVLLERLAVARQLLSPGTVVVSLFLFSEGHEVLECMAWRRGGFGVT